MAVICKMFGSHHFQALKSNWSVSQHNFFLFFYIFNIFILQAQETLTKGYSVPQDFSCIENYKLICQKKGRPKFPLALNFPQPKFLSPLENFIT